jgi:RsiW-degrading membrane proteinase PrsW (M82 family)
MLQPELILIGLAAVAPALVVGGIAAFVTHPDGPTWAGGLIAFLWGALVATLVASRLNDYALAHAPGLVGASFADTLVPALIGPAVEELAKAAGFVAVALAARGALRGVRGRIATGAFIGFGFAVAENASYYLLAAVQGGYDGLGQAIYLRGVVQSANHAVFTAAAGAAIGWADERALRGNARATAVILGLVAAIALHAIWNGVLSHAITAVLCNAPVGTTTCAPAPDTSDLLLGVPALEAAFLIPSAVALRRVARRARA